MNPTNQTERIAAMEEILHFHEGKLRELNAQLDALEEHMDEYKKLVRYYQSEAYQEDLEADEQGRLPADLKRGVLSQDGIYNLIGDYHAASLKMLSLATRFFGE